MASDEEDTTILLGPSARLSAPLRRSLSGGMKSDDVRMFPSWGYVAILVLVSFMLLAIYIPNYDRVPPVERLYHSPYEHKQALSANASIRAVVFSDALNSKLCLTAVTAVGASAIDLDVVGLGRTPDRIAQTFRKIRKLSRKMFGALDRIQSYGEDDLVMYMDAFDVLFVGSGKEIAEKFDEILKRGNHDPKKTVLFNTERACWPWMRQNREVLIPGGLEFCDNYPKGESSFRYLNSGGFIAKQPAAMAILKAWSDDRWSSTDDQEVVSSMFVDPTLSPGFRIILDTRCEIFQTLYGTELCYWCTNAGPYRELDKDGWWDENGRFRNPETKTHPLVVHANFPRKHALATLAARLTKLPIVETEMVRRRDRPRLNWFMKGSQVCNTEMVDGSVV